MQNNTEIKRCDWVGDISIFEKYHDEEWGKLNEDDKVLFEFVVLELSQAGLSWYTIMKKRENYRKAFSNFDYNEVAKFDEGKVAELMNNEGIVRNKMKIEACINNAKVFMEIQGEFGSFSNYIKTFFTSYPLVNNWKNASEVPAKTELSDIMSKDLKKRGFKFFGSVICYSFLQATGYVNDHLVDCSFR